MSLRYMSLRRTTLTKCICLRLGEQLPPARKNLEQKPYEFIKFVAKSAERKAAWTPSAASTWGSMGAASDWKEMDTAGFPRKYPTTTMENPKGNWRCPASVCEGQNDRNQDEGGGVREQTFAVAKIRGKDRSYIRASEGI